MLEASRELMGRAGEPGTVARGVLAGLVVIDGDPGASLRVLADADNVKAVPIGERVRQRQPDRLWLSPPGYYRSF
jgi:imidazolonepropionase-like amidohydrolase